MMTIFDVLADPTRRKILDLLRTSPHQVGDLVDALDISQPGVSKQLRFLREAGLVEVKKDAQRRWYSLRPEPFIELDLWLQGYRHLWEDRFDNLDSLLGEMTDDDRHDE